MAICSHRTAALLLAICTCLVACSPSTREEVIARFSGGEKQIVAIYKGTGADETLIERRTYDVHGGLVSLEDLLAGTTQDWLELVTDLDTPDGLARALQGDWYNSSLFYEGRLSSSYLQEKLTFDGDRYRSSYRIFDTADGMKDPNIDAGSVTYLADLRLLMDEDHADEQAADAKQPDYDRSYSATFHNRHSFSLFRHVVVENRITVEPLLAARYYYDEENATANAVSSDAFNIRNEVRQRAWRIALGGDEAIRTDYPEYYESATGLDPTLNAEALAKHRPSDSSQCIAIGPFSMTSDADYADNARKFYVRQGIWATQRRGRAEVFVGHWVTVKDLKSQAGADRVLSKLSSGGLSDAYLLKSKDGSIDVSLGLFSDRDSADKIVTHAISLGVDATIVPRTRSGDVFFVDVALPDGWDMQALKKRYGSDKVATAEQQNCLPK